MSSSRRLRVRLGERRGEAGRASDSGAGESMRLLTGCMAVGSECARVMGGARGRAEVL